VTQPPAVITRSYPRHRHSTVGTASKDAIPNRCRRWIVDWILIHMERYIWKRNCRRAHPMRRQLSLYPSFPWTCESDAQHTGFFAFASLWYSLCCQPDAINQPGRRMRHRYRANARDGWWPKPPGNLNNFITTCYASALQVPVFMTSDIASITIPMPKIFSKIFSAMPDK